MNKFNLAALKHISSMSLLLLLTACAPKTVDKHTLKIGLPGEPSNLDWTTAKDSSSKGFLDSLVPRLLKYQIDQKGEISLKPFLLESIISVDDSGKLWRLKLKKNHTWTDKTPLTSQHLIDSIERIKNLKTPSPCGVRAREIFGNNKTYFKIIDKLQIELKLTQPYPDFKHELTKICYSPIRKDLVLKYGSKWSQPENMVTLGTFKLKNFSIGKKSVLVRREKDSKKINTLKIIFFDSHSSMLNSFESKSLDFIPLIPESEISRLSSTKGFLKTPRLMTTFLVFNTESEAFNTKIKRKNFLNLIDKNRLKKIIGPYRKINDYFLPNLFLTDSIKNSLKKSPLKSKEFPKKLTVLTHNSPFQLKWLEAIRHQLKGRGVELEVDSKDWVSYINQANTTKADLIRMAWSAETYQVNDFLEIWTSSSPLNRSRWKSKDYDQIVSQIHNLSDGTKKEELISKALQRILYDETILIPLFEDQATQLLSPQIKGFSNLPLSIYDFSEVRRESH